MAALVATGGVARRVLACLLALAGAAVTVIGVVGWTRAEYAAESRAWCRRARRCRRIPHRDASAAARAAGGLLMLAVGVFVVLREPRLARLGARYAAPGARTVEIDPDRAAWQDLDAGRDPTADPARDEGDDPDVGAGRGAG